MSTRARKNSKPFLSPGFPSFSWRKNVIAEFKYRCKSQAKGEKQERPTKLALPHSRVQGKPVRFATDRRFLAHALELGFDTFTLTGADKPVVCREGPRIYLWMTLAVQDALPSHPRANRVPLSVGASPSPASVEQFPARESMPRPAAKEVEADKGRGGWPGLFSLVSRLAALVCDHRRRERDEIV